MRIKNKPGLPAPQNRRRRKRAFPARSLQPGGDETGLGCVLHTGPHLHVCGPGHRVRRVLCAIAGRHHRSAAVLRGRDKYAFIATGDWRCRLGCPTQNGKWMVFGVEHTYGPI